MNVKTAEDLRKVINNLVDKAVDYKTIYDEDAIQALESVKQERWKKFTLESVEIEREQMERRENLEFIEDNMKNGVIPANVLPDGTLICDLCGKGGFTDLTEHLKEERKIK